MCRTPRTDVSDGDAPAPAVPDAREIINMRKREPQGALCLLCPHCCTMLQPLCCQLLAGSIFLRKVRFSLDSWSSVCSYAGAFSTHLWVADVESRTMETGSLSEGNLTLHVCTQSRQRPGR